MDRHLNYINNTSSATKTACNLTMHTYMHMVCIHSVLDQSSLNHCLKHIQICVMSAGIDSLVAAGQIWNIHGQNCKPCRWVASGLTCRQGLLCKFCHGDHTRADLVGIRYNIHNHGCRACWRIARGLHCLRGLDCNYCHSEHTRAEMMLMRGGPRQRAGRAHAILLALRRRMFRRWLRYHYQCRQQFYNVLT